MRTYFHRIPTVFPFLFPNILWGFPDRSNEIFLTFDDGPNPKVTQFVLDVLSKYSAKATFFCLGENVERHPDIACKIVEKGHQIANHGYSHLDGWRISEASYLENIGSGARALSQVSSQNAYLFRPPYGHIRLAQGQALNSVQLEVLWSLMPGDFDSNVTKEKCLNALMNKTKGGDVVVLHDTHLCFDTLKYLLPTYLKYWTDKGYTFKPIDI